MGDISCAGAILLHPCSCSDRDLRRVAFIQPNASERNKKERGYTCPALGLHGISKSYGPLEVLSPTDLTVNSGRVHHASRASGSGKTTLLQIIAGIVEPTKGTIQIGGLDATRLHSRDRQLAMVFQNYALVPHMSVFENVAFPLKIRKHSAAEIREKVRTALASVRLEQYADRKPRQLSGGQQQRVAIARALVYNPSLVLMDEPLGALDKNLRDQLQEEISKLHRTLGVTIIYVTHDQQEAMAMSDRVVLMQQGRIEQAAPPAELYLGRGPGVSRPRSSANPISSAAKSWESGRT